MVWECLGGVYRTDRPLRMIRRSWTMRVVPRITVIRTAPTAAMSSISASEVLVDIQRKLTLT